MSSMDLLNRIKESEEEGEAIRREAMAEARNILAKSDEDTDILIEKGHKETLDQGRDLMERTEALAKDNIEDLKLATEKEIARIRSRAEENQEEAVSYILERVVGNHGSN